MVNETQTLPALTFVIAVSMLSEGPHENSATRRFAGRPVIAMTLDRVGQVAPPIVLCWDDQVNALASAAPDAAVRSLGVRAVSGFLRETEAALRWSDGWRGAPLGRTTFDQGFDAAALLEVIDAASVAGVMLVDPSAAFVDADALRGLAAHLSHAEAQDYAFLPGAVGSGAMLLRTAAIATLARHQRGPGSLVTYHPDRVAHDPIAKAFAAPMPSTVARSLSRVTLDSQRQIDRLAGFDAGDVTNSIETLDAVHDARRDRLPREVVIELTTRRVTRPVWSLAGHEGLTRADLSTEDARTLFEQLAAAGDVRVTFGGVGDPLLHPKLFNFIDIARDHGITALHVETDLLPENIDAIDTLARSGIDLVTIHLPAVHTTTYARLMGVDRLHDVLDNVRRLLLARRDRLPIVVPTLTKCEANLGEMELWYDQWIRAVGVAVIAAPSDFGGRIAYAGVADMTPAVRRACRRLATRLTVLSDGRISSCEEDACGEQTIGDVNNLAGAWHDGSSMLRSLHHERRWDESPVCRACRMWDRP